MAMLKISVQLSS